MTWVVFGDKEGEGYLSVDNIIPKRFKKEPVTFIFGTIQPDEMTTVGDYFSQPLKYIGRYKKELLFFNGVFGGPNDKSFYAYKSIHWINDTRIFRMFSHQSGRDFNWKNNQWK